MGKLSVFLFEKYRSFLKKSLEEDLSNINLEIFSKCAALATDVLPEEETQIQETHLKFPLHFVCL